MLKSLYIKNYALFAETRVEFPAGLNVLTGETGAGKSLLAGALGLILGKRADSSAVFFPDQKCIIEAEFGNFSSRIREKLSAVEDFDIEEGRLVIRREINPAGKSRAFINDTPVSLQVIREVSALLFDLHGQNENQSLLVPEQQLELLDAYAGTAEQVAAFGSQLSQLRETLAEIRQTEASEKKARQEEDYIRFQLNELEEAKLKEGEEAELEQELNLLQNSEGIRDALAFASEQLYDQDLSVYNQLSEVLERLERFSDLNESLGRDVSQLNEAREQLREAAFSLSGLHDTLDSDPERLSYVEERLAVYHKLKLKYQTRSAEALIQRYQDLLSRVEEFDSLEGRIASLRLEAEKKKAALAKEGLRLEAARKAIIAPLEKQINSLLSEVGFQQAHLEIQLGRLTDDNGSLLIEEQGIRPASNGINKVVFFIQTNPGLPPGPLSQIASGGEISRVMLAIKAALADKSEFPVMIFDEIDTGISGEVANQVGKVMRNLSKRFQILSITHLPQIAAKGNDHFLVYKEITGGRTISSVRHLSHDDRVRELAKMISGDDPSESALRNAMELIK